NTTPTVGLELQDAGGTVLATGRADATNSDRRLSYTPTADGTYYVHLNGRVSANYTLVATLDAAFEAEPNHSFVSAQALTGVSGALGHLATTQRLFGVVPQATGPAQIVEVDPTTGAEVRRFAAPVAVPTTGNAPAALAYDGHSLFFISWFTNHS